MNPAPPSKLFWFILLAVFWAFYGLLGRDAWKAEEALALAPILDWLDGARSAWATPAPLYTALAGTLAGLNLGADAQDGARLASGLFTLSALLFTGLTARSLFGAGFGPTAALALVGGFGLMLRAHALLPETALLAAWSALLYGVAAARSHAVGGGIAIGLAMATLTLGLRGWPDLAAALVVVLLPLLSPQWRGRTYRQAVLVGLALAGGLIAGGLILIAAAGNLAAWQEWHGLSRYLPMRAPDGVFSELSWFAWPLWPLAMAALWHAHRRLPRTPELHLPLFALLVLLVAALFPAWSRDGALLPVLLPLAMLAAYALDNLRRGAAQAFYWFGALCFLFFMLAFWVYFAAIEWGFPTRLAMRVARLTPDYQAGAVSTASIVLAAAASLLWLIAIPLFPRAKIRPILVWATGMVLVWVLIAALFRPWIEAGWGYRPLIADLARHLPAPACLNLRVDAAMTVMLRQHLALTQRDDCPWTLTQISRAATETADADAEVIWQGYRPRYKTQIYRLERHGQD